MWENCIYRCTWMFYITSSSHTHKDAFTNVNFNCVFLAKKQSEWTEEKSKSFISIFIYICVTTLFLQNSSSCWRNTSCCSRRLGKLTTVPLRMSTDSNPSVSLCDPRHNRHWDRDSVRPMTSLPVLLVLLYTEFLMTLAVCLGANQMPPWWFHIMDKY